MHYPCNLARYQVISAAALRGLLTLLCLAGALLAGSAGVAQAQQECGVVSGLRAWAVEDNNGDNRLRVHWDAHDTYTTYQLQWRQAANNEVWSDLVSLARPDSSGHEYPPSTDPGLPDDTLYEFQVRAVNAETVASCTPDVWEVVQVYTLGPLTVQVTGVTVTPDVTNLQLEVQWDAVTWPEAPDPANPPTRNYSIQWKSGTEGFNILRRIDSVAASLTSYTITGLTLNTTYTVRVYARSGPPQQNGPPSDEVTVTLGAVTSTPGQVTGLSLTPGDRQIAASWTAGAGGQDRGYEVQWKSGTESFDTSRQATATGTSHTIPNLARGTAYTVQVRATNNLGNGDWSAEATATTAPPQVTGVTVTPGLAKLDVSWTAAAGATGYKVQWKSGSDSFDTSRQATATGTSHTIPSLTGGTAYTVRVIATNAGGDGPVSAEATGTAKLPAPAKVTNVEVVEQFEELLVTWDEVTGARGYIVQWKSGTEVYSTSRQSPEQTEFRDYLIEDLTAGTEYTVRVAATKANADNGQWSGEVTGTPQEVIPYNPFNIFVTAAAGALVVAWDTAGSEDEADSYLVQWKSGMDPYSTSRQRIVTGYDTSTDTIPNLTPGTLYTVRVLGRLDGKIGPLSFIIDEEGNTSPTYIEATGTPTAPANAAPVFAADTATRRFPENTAAGQNIGAVVTATDADTSDTLTYSLSGTDAASFTIVSSSGQLQTKTGVTYDFENPQGGTANNSNAYTVTVTASDGTDDATITVTITVTDVNEAPVFTGTTTPFSVAENTTAVGSAAATDPDSADTSVTYALSGTDDDLFSISADGTLTFAAAPDFEDPKGGTGNNSNEYTFTVTATGGTGDREMDAAQNITVNVTDVNEAPVFTGTTTAFSVPENTTAVGLTAAMEATDEDSADTVTYALSGTDDDLFDIATDGTLTFATAPNFEDPQQGGTTDNSYTVTVEATGGTSTRARTVTQTLTVTVTDVNEAPAFSNATTAFSVAENTTAVGLAEAMKATDEDSADDVTYALSGTDASLFSINTAGTLTFAAAPDYETPKGGASDDSNEYTVTVEATGGTGDRAQDVSQTLTVTVTDENEAPAFTTTATSFSVPENTTAVGSVVAADLDAADTVTYALSGTDGDLFDIATDGAITFATAPNFEDPQQGGTTDNSYTFTVTATGGTGDRAEDVSQTLTVTVTDVNEAPAFSNAITAFSVPENTTAVGLAEAMEATDEDSADTVTYELSGTDASRFSINTAGTLTFAAAPDYETPKGGASDDSNEYTVTVEATGGTGDRAQDVSQTLTVTVTDENEAPAFSTTDTAFSVPENTTGVGSAAATDEDSADDVTYELSGTDASRFNIATDGALTFKTAPNFEDPQQGGATENSYTVTVEATGGTNPRDMTATRDITVTVTDVNEAPGTPVAPTFGSSTATSQEVHWLAPTNTGPAITDYDVQYREVKTPPPAWTDASHAGTTRTLTITGLQEDTEYEVQVRATNAEGTGAWSDSGTTTTGDNSAPVFGASSYSLTLAENADGSSTPVALGGVTATDVDNDDLTYSIVAGNTAGMFAIVATGSSAGALTYTGGGENFESFRTPASAFSLTVRVSDGKASTDVTVTIAVTDVDNEAPEAPAAPTVGATASALTSLAVRWSAPTNEGPPITDYDVQYRRGTSGGWTVHTHDGTALTTTITNLTTDTAYEVQVRATNDEGTGDWSASGTGTPTVAVTGFSLNSPASGDTYREGETIRVTATFNGTVTVDQTAGTPAVVLDIGDEEERAVFMPGTPPGASTSLSFAYTVQPGDQDDDGIVIPENPFHLNNATIRSAADVDALLTHAGLDPQPNHKVDGGPPHVIIPAGHPVRDSTSTPVPTGTTDTAAQAALTAPPPSGTLFTAGGRVYDITVQNSAGADITGTLTRPVQVCLPIPVGVDQNQAHLYRYNPDNGQWERETAGRVVQEREGVIQVCADVTRFSFFRVGAALQQPPSGSGQQPPATGVGGGGGGGGGGGSRDQHGNTPAQATTLAFSPASPRRATAAGQISPAGDIDYFTVTLPRAGLLVVETTGRTDTAGTVWQHDEELASATLGGERRNFRLSTPVEAGPVVIAVTGNGNRTGAYTLVVRLVVGFFENPQPDSAQSGIGVLSGWVCEADTVVIEFDRPDGSVQQLPAALGTSRTDTASVCGHSDTGFGLLWNWNRLGDGEHTVRALVDGEVFAEHTLTVTTLGLGEFPEGLSGTYALMDFPTQGETTGLQWSQAQQNFVIGAGDGATGGETSDPSQARLENPQPGSFQSGVGVISGWVCEAEEVEIVFENGTTGETLSLPAGYGTSRTDTQEVCGDSDNGFGLLWNWNKLGPGEHVVRAFVDGEEMGWARLWVTTLDEEFRRGLAGEYTLTDFPTEGQAVTVEWQEALQNFTITGRQ